MESKFDDLVKSPETIQAKIDELKKDITYLKRLKRAATLLAPKPDNTAVALPTA